MGACLHDAHLLVHVLILLPVTVSVKVSATMVMNLGLRRLDHRDVVLIQLALVAWAIRGAGTVIP
jgi:hypothetical protein